MAVCICALIACKNNKPAINNSTQLAIVKDSVEIMAAQIAKNVSQNGPQEWLKVFDNCPDFFMANNGQLSFSSYDSAANFINHVLVKKISKIELGWSNIRIEPLASNLASLAAGYKENITYFTGKTTVVSGYFTGIAKQTQQGWKLHNAHWSSTGNK